MIATLGGAIFFSELSVVEGVWEVGSGWEVVGAETVILDGSSSMKLAFCFLEEKQEHIDGIHSLLGFYIDKGHGNR